MKSVVIDVQGRHAAILSDDGSIVKIINRNYVIGQVIEMKEIRFDWLKWMPMLAGAAATVVIGIGLYVYYTPYSYVSLDVNPAIEYSLNRFQYVLDVDGLNEDGKAIVSELEKKSLKNLNIQDAIEKTIKQLSQDGYLKTDSDGGIVVAAASQNQNYREQLVKTLENKLKTVVNEDLVAIETYSVGLERVKEARELGITPGKLNLIEKLHNSSSDPNQIKLSDWLDRPVKEIMKEIKSNRQELQEDPKNTQEDDDKHPDSKNDKEAEKEEVKAERAEEKKDEQLAKEEEKQKKEDLKEEEKQQTENLKEEKKDKTDNPNAKNENANKGNSSQEKVKETKKKDN